MKPCGHDDFCGEKFCFFETPIREDEQPFLLNVETLKKYQKEDHTVQTNIIVKQEVTIPKGRRRFEIKKNF